MSNTCQLCEDSKTTDLELVTLQIGVGIFTATSTKQFWICKDCRCRHLGYVLDKIPDLNNGELGQFPETEVKPSGDVKLESMYIDPRDLLGRYPASGPGKVQNGPGHVWKISQSTGAHNGGNLEVDGADSGDIMNYVMSPPQSMHYGMDYQIDQKVDYEKELDTPNSWYNTVLQSGSPMKRAAVFGQCTEIDMVQSPNVDPDRIYFVDPKDLGPSSVDEAYDKQALANRIQELMDEHIRSISTDMEFK